MYYELYNPTSELVERLPLSQWNGKQQTVLTTNSIVPDFSLLPSQVIKKGTTNETTIYSAEVWHNRPLVISFFCPCWGEYGTQHLQYLKQLYPQIKQAGGELWVISNQTSEVVRRLSTYKTLPFTLIADPSYHIARQFGVYSDTAPLWQLVSGVSENAYTPGVFVIDTKGRIQFSQVDKYLENTFSANHIIKAVWESKPLAFD